MRQTSIAAALLVALLVTGCIDTPTSPSPTTPPSAPVCRTVEHPPTSYVSIRPGQPPVVVIVPGWTETICQ